MTWCRPTGNRRFTDAARCLRASAAAVAATRSAAGDTGGGDEAGGKGEGEGGAAAGGGSSHAAPGASEDEFAKEKRAEAAADVAKAWAGLYQVTTPTTSTNVTVIRRSFEGGNAIAFPSRLG